MGDKLPSNFKAFFFKESLRMEKKKSVNTKFSTPFSVPGLLILP